MLDRTVREAARRFGHTAAIVAPDGTPTSYAELDDLATSVAAGLAKRGVSEGCVVALVAPNHVAQVVLYCALARLGAVTAGVSHRLAAPERAAVLDRLRPDVVLTAEDAAEAAALIARVRVNDREPPLVEYDEDRPLVIVLTSGTTGTPRGATFCGRQLAAITRMDVGTEWGGGSPLVVATGLPHIGFMTKLPGHLQRAARMHILERWRAAPVLRVVADERIPVIGGVAAQIALLMRVPDFASYDLTEVRALIVGAGPSPPELVREARERFGAAYSIRYSSTESGGLGTLTAFDAPDEEALHTVGRPRAGTEVEIRDGEVCLRSKSVMTGYWGDDEATARVLRDGWLYTGDLGYLDDAGCLRLTGRATDVYIRGGYNVQPGEVQAVLSEHPAVAEVAVVPRLDPVMGEIGVAVVVARDPTRPPTLGELRDHAAPHLASYKLPEAIHVVDELPLTPMDKVDRRLLMEIVAQLPLR
jgi:acyl-CoA synthetase (AMP-forming)/AMP-acid ligase II